MVIASRSAPVTQTTVIFPVRNLSAALAHYRALGFVLTWLDEDAAVAVVEHSGVVLHLVTRSGPGPTAPPAVAHLFVGDARALAVEWSRPGIDGTTVLSAPVEDGWQAGIHGDPDNNLIHFSSEDDA